MNGCGSHVRFDQFDAPTVDDVDARCGDSHRPTEVIGDSKMHGVILARRLRVTADARAVRTLVGWP
jgi:hypothetical protein